MFGTIGYTELLIIGVIALLLYGQRLPEVAKSWGNTYRDLRRSLNDLKANISADTPAPRPRLESTYEYRDREETAAPKFVPPPAPADSSPAAESPTTNSQA